MKSRAVCEHLWKFSGDFFGKLFDRETRIDMECDLCGLGGSRQAGQLWEKDCKWHDLGQDLGMVETRYRGAPKGMGE